MIRFRWAAPLAVLTMAALHQVLVGMLGDVAEPVWRPLAALALYTVTGSVAVLLGLSWLTRVIGQRATAETELQRTSQDLARLREQLYLLQELGRQAANAADPQEVFALAGRVPMNLLGAKATAVVSLDAKEKRANLEMVWGLSGDAVAALRRAIDSGWPAEACQRCQPLKARLLDTCPLLSPLRAAGYAEGWHGVVCVPLGRGEDRQAVVASYVETAPPRERVQLLNILAAELATALESVQLRNRRVATLAAANEVAAPTGDVDALVTHALDTLLAGWGAQVGAILLLEPESGRWTIRAQRGFGAPAFESTLARVTTWVDEARSMGRSTFWPALGTDDALASAVVVPLLAEGEQWGALVLAATAPDAFRRDHAPLLQALGHQLALAVRNAQLSSRLRELAVIEERYRLAREMHDGLAQSLAAVGLELDRAVRVLAEGRAAAAEESVAAARRAASSAYLELREALDGLRTTVPDAAGLVAALREHAADFAARTGLAVECECALGDACVPPEASLHLLRIVQEALSNVRRHAQAQHVWVRLRAEGDRMELAVADDGLGFDPGLPRSRNHLGLATMRERARAMGGELTLATTPGEGTRVTVRLPLGS